MEKPLHETSHITVEPDPVVTAIIPMQRTSDDLVEALPIQSIPTSIASLFCNLKDDRVRERIFKEIEMIIGIMFF